jgi:hypothetical protein
MYRSTALPPHLFLLTASSCPRTDAAGHERLQAAWNGVSTRFNLFLFGLN